MDCKRGAKKPNLNKNLDFYENYFFVGYSKLAIENSAQL